MQNIILVSGILHNDSMFVYIVIGEGNGSPLQYSCQESPMDRNLVGYGQHDP